jgi:hypothetical protein
MDRLAKVLSMKKARMIREKRAQGRKLQSLADEYGVDIALISRIVNGKAWREAVAPWTT